MPPFNLQEEVQALQDVSTYRIANEHYIDNPDAADELLAGAVEAVAISSDAVTEPEVFDVYRSLLKHSESLSGSTMSKLLDSLSSGLQSEVDATMQDMDQEDQDVLLAHKQPLEMFVFLLHWFVSAAEKVRSKDEDDGGAAAKPKRGKAGSKATSSRTNARKTNATWTWAAQIPATLALLSKLLRIKSHRIWTTSVERDTFINCVTRPAYHIAEGEIYMKNNEIRLGVYKVICLAVKFHGHGFGAQISIMQCLQYFDYLSDPMAEALAVLVKEFDHPQLAEEILREIAAKSFSAQDTKGPKSFSRFLIHLTELAPRLVLKQMSLLLAHLDSEAYPMRMALVEMIGLLIRELALSEDGEKEAREKQIKGFFELLSERFLDLSVYVRSKVINTLGRLCDIPAKFPQQRLHTTELVIGALEDKGSSVRRYAIALLTKLILTHPYGLMHGGLLKLEEWEQRYNAVCKELEAVQVNELQNQTAGEADDQSDGEDDAEDADTGNDVKMEDDVTPKKPRRVKPGDDESVDADQASNDEMDETDGSRHGRSNSEDTPVAKKSNRSKMGRKSDAMHLSAITNEQAALAALESHHLMHLKLRKRYYAEALSFIRQIEGAMEMIGRLLGSKNKPEVLEAMEFFRVAHEYQFDGAEAGVKRMLHLIWSKDDTSVGEDGKELKGIRSRLLECYRSLYFDPLPDMEPKQQVNRITKNMIELTYDATLAELTSLEELMRTMMDDDQIHGDVISKLWQVYSSNKPLPKEQRRGAIIILGMLARAKRQVVTERVETLLRVGLGPLGKADLVLCRYTCIALQRLNGSVKKVKGSLIDKSVRLPMDNAIFRKLQDVIESGSRSKDWFGVAEQAINTIYALGERPDFLCDTIIKSLTRQVFGNQPTVDRAVKDVSMADDSVREESTVEDQSTVNGESGAADQGDAFRLSQLIFIVGHVAIKHIVFLELVEREMKRQKEEGTVDKLATGTSPARGAGKGEELDQVAGNAEDEIGDRISGIRETEMLYGPESLLALFGPMIVHICGSPRKFKSPVLRAAATLSFSKFLCVSSQFCDQHHRLLFKILETSKDATIRSNIVIALGDVAVCFSNIIDENSNELYKGLTDENGVVKKNTLMVLTHLILNGMIKIKGQLGEMAKCLEDEDPRIADLAKLFFKELSGKDNAIYNNLPDVISHLSVGEHAVDEEVFQSTMKYIFTFIEKDKQAENIVEKLCQRMRLTDESRQWRDIAFCMSLLPFKSDRSLKKLIEGLPFYQDKLHEETVFARFTEILTKARANKSSSKPDAELNEFERILTDFKNQGEEDQALEKRAENKKAAAKKRAARRTTGKKS